MKPSMRWFGPHDPIKLRDMRQAGVTDVVTALHHVPCGELWTEEAIAQRLREVEIDPETEKPSGLKWSVVESLPVHESIKRRSDGFEKAIEVYKQSLRNLARAGLKIICYNFMPVLDWTRSELNQVQEDGTGVLFYDADAIAAFDLFMLQREGAECDYSDEEWQQARDYFETLDETGVQKLCDTILFGLPGTVEDMTMEMFRDELAKYAEIDDQRLRHNLYAFLREIAPLCETLGIKMAIHPDDPPRPLFGLPRIMSCAADIEQLYRELPSRSCGLTFCTGSFGAGYENDPAQMLEDYAERVYFVHLRNIRYVEGSRKSFYESPEHLRGHVDMYRAVKAVVAEEERRRAAGEEDCGIIMRPDHGKLMDEDKDKGVYPGYSGKSRMLALAELRGLEFALRYGKNSLR